MKTAEVPCIIDGKFERREVMIIQTVKMTETEWKGYRFWIHAAINAISENYFAATDPQSGMFICIYYGKQNTIREAKRKLLAVGRQRFNELVSASQQRILEAQEVNRG